MSLFKVNRLNRWFKLLGQFLIILGVVTALLWSIRLTYFRSMQFIIYVDDVLGMGIAFILLIPTGFWFNYIGANFDRYERVNIYPLVLISITPIVIIVFSLTFLPLNFNLFAVCIAFTLKAFGWVDGQVVLFSSIIICVFTFVSGNILLLCQILRSNKLPIRFTKL